MRKLQVRPPPSVQLAARVPPDLRKRIEAEAKREGVTVSMLVAYALEARFPAPVRR
jgi:predicted HicB family RNase H-like nuclease